MKKKNIFKLFSLLGLGSVVGLAAASCAEASKDVSKVDAEKVVNALAEANIESYKKGSNNQDEKITTKGEVETKDVTKFDLVKTEKDKLSGWTVTTAATANTINEADAALGKIKVTVKAVKGNDTVSKEIEVTGFKKTVKAETDDKKDDGKKEEVPPQKDEPKPEAEVSKQDAEKVLKELTTNDFDVAKDTMAESATKENFTLKNESKTKVPNGWTISVDEAKPDKAKKQVTVTVSFTNSKKTDEKVTRTDLVFTLEK
ncbi:lipoprotein 17-related variable surface protein [Mycoplasma sp. E35C]|uniref:lipoprotein 17-related variable surface protein n=1 Tax=Mycoplasma sp. E35C TaxID=2801918 RepID=UPI001CA469C5|nr:lipoprotein 17-related variable surface protein [Mycoplasma sp. E35C]QZX48875.1 hypothetical protein JJE79_02340 [Mycoplasma sp. E35C]